MTTVGELFVGLGVKGSEKTLGAISGVRQGLKDTASTSLETKAAILGAMYALQRLFSTSGQAGTNLTNFNAVTGVTMETLQRYQYVARSVGSSNEVMAGTFKSIQSVMTDISTGKGLPADFGRVASKLKGGLTSSDVQKYKINPELFLQRLQDEYLPNEPDKGWAQKALTSFGVGDSNIQAGLFRKKFTQDMLNRAPTYSDREVKALDTANIAWSNLGTKIEMAVGHFNAKHGVQLVQDISKITDQVLKLVEAFTKLAEKLKLFELAGKSFEGWEMILKGITAAIDSKNGAEPSQGSIGNLEKNIDEKRNGLGIAERIRDAILSGGTGTGESISGILIDMLKTGFTSDGTDGRASEKPQPAFKALSPQAVAPKMAPTAVAAPGAAQNVEVNQTLNFNHDGRDAKKTGDSTKKAVQDAFRQIGAQAQGS